MSVSLVGQLLSSFYSLVKEEAKTKRKMTRTRAGHLFEDVTARKIYSHARSLGLRPNPPRYTLNYPTFSGLTYQFDGSFNLGNAVYVVECKRTKIPAKVHLHYFNSQILDYLFGARAKKDELVMNGIFLSTVRVKRNSMIYAIANGIMVIDPVSPPLEHMRSTLEEGSVLFRAIEQLLEKWPDSRTILDFGRVRRWSASDLLKEYRFLCKRWRSEVEA